jgi:hypothetical protein
MATKAAIELNGENSAQVLVFLEAATPCELGEPLPFEMGTLYPAYLRGKVSRRDLVLGTYDTHGFPSIAVR